MRIRAYKELGLQEVNVSVVDAPTEAKKIEYALSDNDRVGYYEEEALAELIYPHIKDIDLGEFKVDIGEPIDLKQVVERYGPDIDDGADEVPEVDDTPAVTKPGDLFTLGRHRVMCGDSTKAEDVARLMRGEKAELCFTDPPYNVGRTYTENTNDQRDDYRAWSLGWFSIAGGCAANVAFSCGHPNVPMWAGIKEWKWIICWYKPNAMLGSPFGFSNWEPVLFYGTTKSRGGDVVNVPIVPDKELDGKHPVPKQIGFGIKFLELLTDSGHLVLDPFLGSGTTLIAAEKLNRTCYGMEIDPKYCDVIIKRYCDYAHVDEASVRATREAA
jgi:DNA modification methylase